MTNAFPSMPSVGSRKKRTPIGEGELLSLFALFPDAALLVDSTRSTIVQANPAFLQLTSFSLGEVVGHKPDEFLSGLSPVNHMPDDTVQLCVTRRGKTPTAVSLQMRMLDQNGTWLLMICRPLVDQRSRMLSDITAAVDSVRKMDRLVGSIRQEREKQGGDQELNLLPECAALIKNTFGAKSVAFYQIGEGSADLKKVCASDEDTPLPDLISAEDYLSLARPMVWRPGKRMQTELHRAGRVKGFSYIISTQFEPAGIAVLAGDDRDPWIGMETLLSMVVNHMALLVRVDAQDSQLRASLDKAYLDMFLWKQAVESAGEGMMILSPDRTVREMNPNAEWLLGYASWEVQGQPVENVLIGPEGLAPALEAARQGLPTHNMGVVPLHRRSGQSFPAQVQVIPVVKEDQTLGILVFFSDVSENEESRQRTQQLEQRAILGEVTAVFAHEVRNPINNISTGLQLLSVKLPETDPNQENINRLINDCQRLNHLMESVLNFSRQMEYKFEEVDLTVLLRRILDRWRPRMSKVNVNFFMNAETEAPHALGDPRSLEQVFTNLISNAVEAMSAKGGTLAVHIAPVYSLPGHPQVEVTVSDTGPGIPDDVRERIFEPFVTTKSSGTGLGLAITKRIVTAHHGFIDVNSFPVGTVFRVILSAFQGEKAS